MKADIQAGGWGSGPRGSALETQRPTCVKGKCRGAEELSPTPFPRNKPAGSAPLSAVEATSQGLVLRGVQLTRRDLKKPFELVMGWVLARVGSCLWCEEPASRQRGERRSQREVRELVSRPTVALGGLASAIFEGN